MKKGYLLIALALAPVVSVAATYDYVDTGGQLKAVEAANAPQAMVLAVNKAPTSGVILDRGAIKGPIVSSGAHIFQYVDTTGRIRSVQAMSADEALALTTASRAHNSGVIATAVAAIPPSAQVSL